MGESDRYQEYRIKKQRFTLGQDGNALMWLVVINAIFFLVLLLAHAAYNIYQKPAELYYNQVGQWFELPGTFAKLGERPWTLFTAMFTDISVLRILSNMIWLWAFGSILQGVAANKRVIPIYMYGGVIGAIFFLLANAFLPSLQQTAGLVGLMGANAAVLAVAVSTCMFAPNYRFFPMLGGGIPIWALLAIYLFIDFVGINANYAAYSISHFGGALAGCLFVVFLRRGWDGSKWMNSAYNWFINLFNPYKKNSGSSVKEKVFYNTGNRAPYSKTSNVTEQRIDEILDKINQKGYSYLTEDEKNILKRASEE